MGWKCQHPTVHIFRKATLTQANPIPTREWTAQRKTSFSQLTRAWPKLDHQISCKASRKSANFGPASCNPRWMACRMSLLFREPAHVGETCMLSWWNPAAWIILDISDINLWMPTGSTRTPLFLVFLSKGSYTPCGLRLVATFALEVCPHKGPGFVVEERNIYGSLKKDGQFQGEALQHFNNIVVLAWFFSSLTHDSRTHLGSFQWLHLL